MGFKIYPIQPELVCQIPWPSNEGPELVTAVALNSAYGVIAIGTCVGIALVDLISSSLIYTWQNSELYGRDSIPFSLPSQNSDVSPSEVYLIRNTQISICELKKLLSFFWMYN